MLKKAWPMQRNIIEEAETKCGSNPYKYTAIGYSIDQLGNRVHGPWGMKIPEELARGKS